MIGTQTASTQSDLCYELQSVSTLIEEYGGQQVATIHEHQIRALHQSFKRSIPDIHRLALKQGILPMRYLRNHSTISVQEQSLLAQKRVAVIGAGGLGGQVLLSLARIGVGHLLVLDPGRFDESNLNRQALCTPACLGLPKAQVAKCVLEELNPAVRVQAHPLRLTSDNRSEFLSQVDVVVDALDSIQDRFVLETGAKEAGIPMVHAAIDGFVGQLLTIFPQDQGLSLIYGQPQGEEPPSPLGNLPMTAHSLATLQAMEVIKILLGRGKLYRREMLAMELEEGLVDRFSFSGDAR